MIERDASYISDVKIINVEKRYRPGPKHYVYVIQVTWSNPNNVFIIYRRYAQFFDLQCKLLDLFAEAPTPSNEMKSQFRQIPFLPGKIIFGRSQIREIALERKHTLNIYCQTLISLPERISRSRPVLEFFRPQADDVRNPDQSSLPTRQNMTKSSISISQPVNLPIYRCIEDFNAVEKIELSVKQNTRVQVIQKHLNGWWYVQVGDRKGFVPGAFLEPVEDRERQNTSIPSAGHYVVNRTHQATGRDEISLEQGSFVTLLEKSYTGWWLVKFHDQVGLFPAVYLTSCEGRTVPEPISVTPSITRHDQSTDDDDEETNANELPMTRTEIFYVHTDFNDKVGDCIPLKRGETIEVYHQHDSGWWLGRKLNSNHGNLSWIPSAFLQKEPIESTPILQNSSDPRTENLYQNIGHVISAESFQTDPTPSISTKTIEIPVSQPSVDNESQSTKVSVRDLVKKFNRPLL